MRVSCEEVEGDADGDGVRRPRDCNDANPQIRPGVADPPDDGVDQDCSGADATNLDRDADGFPVPQDCDDRNAAIRPGAREVRGNRVDENCDEEVVPFPPLAGSVSNAWLVEANGTRNVTLSAKGFSRRTRIRMRCSGPGCSIGEVRRRVRSPPPRGRPAPLPRRPPAAPGRPPDAQLHARTARRPRAALPDQVGGAAGRRLPLQAAQPPGARLLTATRGRASCT